MRDNNGGIPPSGLFWTVALPPGAFAVTGNGRTALLMANDVPVIDTFQFASPFLIPSTVSFRVRWDTIGPAVPRGMGSAVAPTDPAAFLGTFAEARAIGRMSGSALGFSFVSDPGASSDAGYAQLGRERNGVLLG